MAFDFGLVKKVYDVLAPEHWNKIIKARANDLNPLAGGIAANEDLIRALRQAWISAAQQVFGAVAAQSGSPEWRAERAAIAHSTGVIDQRLKQIRDASFDRGKAPEPSPIDGFLDDVLNGVPEYVLARDLALSERLTREFAATLQSVMGWDTPVSELYGIAAGSGRRFGELVFAAFAEIVKHPAQHQESAAAFQVAQESMTRGVVRETLSTAQAIEQKIDRIEERLGSTAAPPTFEWPLAQSFVQHIEEKSEGFTGRELLQQRVLDWLGAAKAEQVMLIAAPFGVGKSAFMAHLCRTLAGRGMKTAVHFCRFDAQDTLEPGKIVRSLAAQFAADVQAYRDALAAGSEAQRALAAADTDARTAWSRGVVDLLMRLADLKPDQPHVVLIDGLDESLELHNAQAGGKGSLLDLVLMASASRLPPWVRVIISSREVPQLGGRTDSFKRIDMLGNHGLENREDLVQYVRSRCRHERVQQLLQQASREEHEFVQRLADLCEGKFLLAQYLMNEAQKSDFDAAALDRLLRRSRDIPGMDAFYESVFDRRVSDNAKLDPARVAAVLGVVVVALDPLPEAAIADVLADARITAGDVRAVVDALGGLLKSDGQGGITFDHFSIEQWLDPTKEEGQRNGRAKAGAHAIDRPASTERLQVHCQRFAEAADPLAAAKSFAGYLQRRGVVHLLDRDALPSALSLLVALQARGQRAPAAKGRLAETLRALEAQLIDAIDQRLDAIDEGDAAPADALRQLAPQHLARLLQTRDYETGKFQPVIRTLVQFHPQAWPGIGRRLLEHDDDDLVLRADIGVAQARAWHSSSERAREHLLGDIEAMAHDAQDDGRREIAGYALKHICQRIHGGAWWRDVAGTLKALAGRYARSETSVDRMVAGEMLLSLAMQGEPVMQWFAPDPALDAFWDPSWPNLRADIAAIRAAVPAGAPPAGAEMEQAVASCAEHDALAQRLTDRLLADALFTASDSSPGLSRLHGIVASMAEQQCDKAVLDAALPDIEAIVDDPQQRELVFDLVCRLMLHPLWDVTESASNLVADLIKRQGRSNRWWLIERLLASDAALWRLRYGAVDAAYTAGAVDGCAKFKQALLQVGRDAHCRVRGICADDFRAWVLYADAPARRAILRDPEIVALLRCWLEEADDTWLLEYLHLLTHELAHGRLRDPAALKALLPEKLSRFLAPDGARAFYDLSGDEFLARIEAQRRAEWQALRGVRPSAAGS